MLLNFQNVPEKVFADPAAARLLPPHLSGLVRQWKLGVMAPALRDVGRRAVADFLSAVRREDLERLEPIFGCVPEVDRLPHASALHVEVDADDVQTISSAADRFGAGDFSVSRSGERLLVTFWR